MQLAAIRQRIGNTREIENVIVAMRAIAAAHLREARKHVSAIRGHEESVSKAMSQALALLPAADRPAPAGNGTDGRLVIVVGAGQGFCGLYNETIVAAALDDEHAAASEFFVVGQRCAAEFLERGRSPALSFDQAARATDILRLASLVADNLYDRITRGGARRVDIAYTDPDSDTPVRRELVPFDFSRIGQPPSGNPPLTQMPLASLLSELVQEYVFSEICEALMLGFAAENNARMQAMLRARSNVSRVIEDLERDYFKARQEHTTAEILELSESV